MADMEKNAGNAHLPLGPDRGYPYTLGASAAQQAVYQGGLPVRKFANPAPLGLFSFASTTLVLSLINIQTDGVATPNIVVGMAFFVGGLCQMLAGMWEFAAGNTLGATAFTSYGGFWMSYGTIFIPGTGILAAYGTDKAELGHAIGFYLSVWFIFTFFMFISSLRSNVGLIVLFFCLMVTFMFLMISSFVANTHVATAGGAFGVATAFIAYYCGCANMLTPESSFFQLPLIPVSSGKDD